MVAVVGRASMILVMCVHSLTHICFKSLIGHNYISHVSDISALIGHNYIMFTSLWQDHQVAPISGWRLYLQKKKNVLLVPLARSHRIGKFFLLYSNELTHRLDKFSHTNCSIHVNCMHHDVRKIVACVMTGIIQYPNRDIKCWRPFCTASEIGRLPHLVVVTWKYKKPCYFTICHLVMSNVCLRHR